MLQWRLDTLRGVFLCSHCLWMGRCLMYSGTEVKNINSPLWNSKAHKSRTKTADGRLYQRAKCEVKALLCCRLLSKTYFWSAMLVQEFRSPCAVLGLADLWFLFVLWKRWERRWVMWEDVSVHVSTRRPIKAQHHNKKYNIPLVLYFLININKMIRVIMSNPVWQTKTHFRKNLSMNNNLDSKILSVIKLLPDSFCILVTVCCDIFFWRRATTSLPSLSFGWFHSH